MTLKGDIFLPDKVTVEGDEYIVSPGMCRALNGYIDLVQKMQKNAEVLLLEQRLVVPDTFGMVWGTMDCGAYVGGSILVADLKYGKGHVVEPDAPQLKLYGLGFAHVIGATAADTPVTSIIYQPRVGSKPLRIYDTTLGDLRRWSRSEVHPALKRIKVGDTTEHAGSHCRWCVRQTECAAFARLHQTRAASAFDDEGLF